jgi:hypothetical protein
MMADSAGNEPTLTSFEMFRHHDFIVDCGFVEVYQLKEDIYAVSLLGGHCTGQLPVSSFEQVFKIQGK